MSPAQIRELRTVARRLGVHLEWADRRGRTLESADGALYGRLLGVSATDRIGAVLRGWRVSQPRQRDRAWVVDCFAPREVSRG